MVLSEDGVHHHVSKPQGKASAPFVAIFLRSTGRTSESSIEACVENMIGSELNF